MMELGNLVIFSEEAIKYYESEELESICVMHDFPKSPYFNLKPGQFLRVGEREFEIFAVGEAVNHNIKNYGHSTFRFVGKSFDGEMKSGDILVASTEIPPVAPGTVIKVYSK